MEDLLMSNKVSIKSSIKDYEALFVDDFKTVIASYIEPGDFILIDRVLVNHPELEKILAKNQNIILIDASENAKSYEGIIPIIDTLIKMGIKRNNKLIAIGGGVTQDITSFTASILYRGVKWIFIPTTLLAQGDSCIGSKTSINFGTFKNQLGNFYPPEKIFINTRFLNTLQERDIRSGVGEMAHYFFVSSENDVDFFEKEYSTAICKGSNLKKMILASLSIKKRYIEIDEFDNRERIVFNYGHTFGHAIESIFNYSIPHGVAVAFGMDMANFISYKKGYISHEVFKRARKILKDICVGYSISNIDIENLIDLMMKDKKNENGKIGFILTKGWGNMFKDLTSPDDIFVKWLYEYFEC